MATSAATSSSERTALGDDAQVPEGPAPAARATTASTRRSSSRTWPSVTASIRLRLRCEQLGHRLVDRVRRQQVPGGHGAVLADPVQPVLGLVVAGRRPVELEERDVRGARERDALRRGLQRAHDQLRAVLALERVHGALAVVGSSPPPGCGPRPGSAPSRPSEWRCARRRRRAARPTPGSPRSRRARSAACRARRAGAGG